MISQQARQWVERLLRSRLFRDSSVLLVADWSALALSIVASVILARALGSSGYGLIILAMAIVDTIVQFMDIRTEEGLIRFMVNALARDAHHEAMTFFYISLITDTVLTAATFLLVATAGPLSTRVYPDAAMLRSMVNIYLWSVPFVTLEGTFSAVLNVFKRFNLRAAVMMVKSLFLLTCLIVAMPHGLLAVMWAQVIAAGFSFVVWVMLGTWLLVKNVRTLRPQNLRQAWRTFLPFAFHTSLSASIKAIAVNLPILLLGAMRTTSEVSYFKIARSAASLLSMPTAPASMVIYPEMNEAWAHSNLGRVRRLVWRYVTYTLAISVGLYLALGLAARELVLIFYGPDYLPVAPVIRVLGFGVVLEAVFRWVRPATLAGGKPQLTTYYSTASILLRTVLEVLLIYFYGTIGAALAYDATVTFTCTLIVFYVLPHLGLWTPFRQKVSASPAGDDQQTS